MGGGPLQQSSGDGQTPGLDLPRAHRPHAKNEPDSFLLRIESHPPFYFYDRASHAMQAGQFEQAARLFEKSLSQRPYDVPSHFELAIAAAHLGDMRRARKQLEFAMKNSTTPDSRVIYAAKLRHLESLN